MASQVNFILKEKCGNQLRSGVLHTYIHTYKHTHLSRLCTAVSAQKMVAALTAAVRRAWIAQTQTTFHAGVDASAVCR